VGSNPTPSARPLILLTFSPHRFLAVGAIETTEEIVYRGFLQPAFVRLGGVGPGLWTTGIIFGLLHWGLSVGILAALPSSLLIGIGSVAWGKAAHETNGLGLSIVSHFMIDVAVMAAYFV
jgi:membrane protease YdiL (CAAX protease family)